MHQGIKLYEIHYASTQESIVTGRDGFGIRTYTEALPPKLLTLVSDLGVFNYNSGRKPLAAMADIIDYPMLPMGFPASINFQTIVLDGKKWGMLCRTVFIGIDYLFYLPGQADRARSGNVFSHVYLWEWDKATARETISTLLPTFVPVNVANTIDNRELKELLLGSPATLPSRQITLPIRNEHSGIEDDQSVFQFLRLLMQAAITGVTLNVTCLEIKVATLLAIALRRVPNLLWAQLSIQTNQQSQQLGGRGRLVFRNEYHISNPASIEGAPQFQLENPHADTTGFSQFIDDYIKIAQRGNIPQIEDIDQVLLDSLQENLAPNQWDAFWNIARYSWELDEIMLKDFATHVEGFEWKAASNHLKQAFLERTYGLLITFLQKGDFANGAAAMELIRLAVVANLVAPKQVPTEVKKAVTDWLSNTAACKSWSEQTLDQASILHLVNWPDLQPVAISVLRNLQIQPMLLPIALEQLRKGMSQEKQVELLINAASHSVVALDDAKGEFTKLDVNWLRQFLVAQGFMVGMPEQLREALLGTQIQNIVSEYMERGGIPELARKLAAKTGQVPNLQNNFRKWLVSTQSTPLQKLEATLAWEANFGQLSEGDSLACSFLEEALVKNEALLTQSLLNNLLSQVKGKNGFYRRTNWLLQAFDSPVISDALSSLIKILEPAREPTTLDRYLRFTFRHWNQKNYLQKADHLHCIMAWDQALGHSISTRDGLQLTGAAYYLWMTLEYLTEKEHRLDAMTSICVALQSAWEKPTKTSGNRPKAQPKLDTAKSLAFADQLCKIAGRIDSGTYKRCLSTLANDPAFSKELYTRLSGGMVDRVKRFFGGFR